YEHKNLFCKRIDSNRVKPIRTNLSRSANTGLSLMEDELFSSPGLNNNYSKFIEVKEGDEYVLVVNNPKRAGGNHTLILHFPDKIRKAEPTTVKTIVKDTPKLDFSFEVKDANSNQPVSSNATLSGLLKEVVELQNVTHYQAITERAN